MAWGWLIILLSLAHAWANYGLGLEASFRIPWVLHLINYALPYVLVTQLLTRLHIFATNEALPKRTWLRRMLWALTALHLLRWVLPVFDSVTLEGMVLIYTYFIVSPVFGEEWKVPKAQKWSSFGLLLLPAVLYVVLGMLLSHVADRYWNADFSA